MARSYAPRFSVPGGAAKRAEPLTEAQLGLAGRGAILNCSSPLLRDPAVLEAFQRVCKAYPLRPEAAPVAAAMASYEIRAHRLLMKPKKSFADWTDIQRLTAALGACLTKLSTLRIKPAGKFSAAVPMAIPE